MHFVRIAGCNVGKHPSTVEWELGQDRNFPILKTGSVAPVCHTYDGRMFLCDTDYWKGTVTEIEDILDDTWENHLCITGGEPLLHLEKLEILAQRCETRGINLHIESSGTIKALVSGWLTISPKAGFNEEMISFADEIKLLIDPGFKLSEVPQCIRDHPRVYVQPINHELSINIANFKLCQEVLRVRPDWKLSIQLHKFLNVR
jgi:organic radical activating enzyme